MLLFRLLSLCLAAPILLSATESNFIQTFSDTLLPRADRPAGASLNGLHASEGAWAWRATKALTIGESGATASAPSGAHCAVHPVAGVVHVQADVNASGSGFTGLALGRGDLSGDFWQNLSLVFFVTGDGDFNVYSGSVPLIPKRDKSLVLVGQPNRLDLVVDTVARTITAKLNGNTVMNSVPAPEAARVSEISAAGFRFNEPVKTGEPSVARYQARIETTASSGLEPVDYAMTFVEPSKPATLEWKVGSPGPAGKIAYTIKDYSGQPAGGGWAAIGVDRTARVQVTLPRGYYEIAFPEAAQTFGLVSIEAWKDAPDLFFGMDSAFTQLEQNPSKREAFVRILARSGIAISRERGVHPSLPPSGKLDWEGSLGRDTLRRLYAKNGVQVLEIVGEGGPAKNLPESAFAISEMCKRWPMWGGVEAGNEPDLKGRPADHYVELVKTLSYGLRQAESKVPLISGVFAGIPPGPFFDACVANGMLEDSDAVSFHSYDRAPEVEGMVARYRHWLKQNGKETLPLWHTECGWSWRKGPNRPPLDQDIASAMEITAKTIETRACGVARHFPFVMPFYEEGAKNFSMLGREGSPLRGMAAYAAAIRFLGGQPYAGDLAGVDHAVKLARVFGSGDELIAVLYTGDANPEKVVAFPYQIKQAAGADGRAIQLTKAGLPVPDGLAYVWLTRTALGTNLITDTEAMRLFEFGQTSLVQKRRASPFIVRFLSEETPSQATARRYLISRKTAENLPIRARIFNLSPLEVKVTPILRIPGKPPENAAPVILPGMGSVDVSWKLDALPYLDIAEVRFVVVSASAESSSSSAHTAIPFVIQGTLEQHMAKYSRKFPLPITELDRWIKNQSSGTIDFSSPGDGIWRADVKFTEGSSWTFPRFKLPEKLDLKTYSGFLVRARVLGAPQNASSATTAGNVSVIAKSGNGIPSFWVSDILPSDGEWQVVYVPFGEFKPGPNETGNQNTRLAPELWQSVEVGFNHGKENTFEISHLMLVGE